MQKTEILALTFLASGALFLIFLTSLSYTNTKEDLYSDFTSTQQQDNAILSHSQPISYEERTSNQRQQVIAPEHLKPPFSNESIQDVLVDPQNLLMTWHASDVFQSFSPDNQALIYDVFPRVIPVVPTLHEAQQALSVSMSYSPYNGSWQEQSYYYQSMINIIGLERWLEETAKSPFFRTHNEALSYKLWYQSEKFWAEQFGMEIPEHFK